MAPPISFKTQMQLGFSCIIGFFLLISLLSLYQLYSIQKQVGELEASVLPYALLSQQMAFDVVQVQQFLTDVSATHNPAAYQEAEEAAESFKSGIVRFRQRYQSNPDRLREVDNLTRKFDRYYTDGKEMAEAYLSQGVEAGNRLMEGFDSTAGDLTALMDNLKNIHVKAAEKATLEISGNAYNYSAWMVGIF